MKDNKAVISRLNPELTMSKLSLGIGAQGLERLGQRDPFLELLGVTLTIQRWQKHDEVKTHCLVTVAPKHTG